MILDKTSVTSTADQDELDIILEDDADYEREPVRSLFFQTNSGAPALRKIPDADFWTQICFWIKLSDSSTYNIATFQSENNNSISGDTF